MKVLLDGRIMSNDGIGRYTKQVISSLIDQKNNSYEIVVREPNCPINHTILSNSLRYTWEELSEMDEIIQGNHLDVVHFFDYKIARDVQTVPMIVSIHDIFRYSSPDLCYDDDTFALRYGITRLNEIKAIVNHYEAIIDRGHTERKPRSCDFAHYKYYRAMLIWSLFNSDVIVVPSQYVKSEILKNFTVDKEKIRAVHYGIDHIHVCKQTIKRENSFIYIGQNRPHKNVQSILKAAAYFIRRHPDYKLKLIGGDFCKESHGFATYGLGDSLVLKGFISDDELALEYASAKAIIHVSHEEGFGFTPLEAMMNRCAVISSKTPIAEEILGELPIYVKDYDDPDSIEQAMEEAIHVGDKEREKLSTYASQFKWSVYTSALEEIYQNVCEKSRKQ